MADLRAPEVAARLVMSVADVYRLIDAGELPLAQDEHGHIVVADDAVLAYAERTGKLRTFETPADTDLPYE